MCSHKFLDLFGGRQRGPMCGCYQVERRGHICNHLGPLGCPQSSFRGLQLSFTLFIQHLTSPCIVSHLKSYCTIFPISSYVGFKEVAGWHPHWSCPTSSGIKVGPGPGFNIRDSERLTCYSILYVV